MAKIRIIQTEDGSQSLYHEELNETYHSTHGALQESRHVFIKHGLEYLHALGTSQVNILEVGFGTGLNALLAYQYAKDNPDAVINYVTLEPFPIDNELVSNLLYDELLEESITRADFERLHDCSWAKPHQLLPNFSFQKETTTIQNFKSDLVFDLVFYDAFAPSKQSEMWELEVLDNTVNQMTENGVLVTYCASGQFKRNLKALDLNIEVLDGPPGKKEMVRATKP